jgi:GTP-binding protein HflX
MRALTGSAVLVENKLFATLDTTIRALQPETRPRILISDTVGFIKKLPHDLVASFRSTLDEALQASLLLHVVDASDPDWESQLEVTNSVLADIGAQGVPSRVVMNKVDLVSAADRILLEDRFPDAWFVSAKSAEDVSRLHAQIVETFESSYREVELLVPYDRQRLVSEMHENGRVLGQEYEEAGVRVRWLTDPLTIDRLQSALTA